MSSSSWKAALIQFNLQVLYYPHPTNLKCGCALEMCLKVDDETLHVH